MSDVKLYLKVVSWDLENNLLWMKSAFTQHRARASIVLLSSSSTTIKLSCCFLQGQPTTFGFTQSIYLKSNLLDSQGFFQWVYVSLLPSNILSCIIIDMRLLHGWLICLNSLLTLSLTPYIFLLRFPTFSHFLNARLPIRHLHNSSSSSSDVIQHKLHQDGTQSLNLSSCHLSPV